MVSRILGALAAVAVAVSCAAAEEPNNIGQYIQASPGVVMPQYTRNTQDLYCDGGDFAISVGHYFTTGAGASSPIRTIFLNREAT